MDPEKTDAKPTADDPSPTAVQGTQASDESSQSQKQEKAPTVEEAVEAVVQQHVSDSPDEATPEKEDVEEAVSTSEEEAEKTEEVEGEEEAKAESKDEALPPFHEHPRWQEQVSWRKEAEPKVKAFDTLNDYRSEYKIDNEQFRSALELLALANTDPQKALTALRPFVEQLETQTGDRLPEDLQKEVDEGLVTQDRATELANARVEIKQRGIREQQQQADATAKLNKQVEREMNKWFDGVVTRDPDMKEGSEKYELVLGQLGRLWQTQPPQTVIDAVALQQKAYDKVSKSLSANRPKPKSRRVLSSNGTATTLTKEPPKTIDEGVDRVLAKHYG